MSQNEPLKAEAPLTSSSPTPSLPRPLASQAEPLIAPGARFEGTLTFHGEARIDGDFEGRLLGRGRLVLGPAARVRAEVDVDELVVAGRLDGSVQARTRVILQSTSQVDAVIESGSLQIEPGATLNGRCRAGTSPDSRDPKGETTAPPG